jgi:hypothetical protein
MTTRGNFVVADQKMAGRNRAHCIHVSELHSIQSIAESLQKTVLADDCLLSIQSISLQINSFSAGYFFTTSDILIELFYNVNISARIHPPLKQRTPLKS